MKPETVKKYAKDLEGKLVNYARHDKEAKVLYDSLRNIIDLAKSGKIHDVVDDIPGRHWFSEGDLSKYPDLENSYAKFKLEITLEESQESKNFDAWAEQRMKELNRDK